VHIEAEFGVRLPTDFADQHDAAALALYAGGDLATVAGIETVLATLRGPSCIASGSAPAKIAAGLASTGLDAHFGERYVSARQVARGKPFPDVFLFAAERFGATVEQCVVVEDSLTGVRAARAAGMPVFGLVGSFSAASLAAEGAVPVRHPGELLGQPRFRVAAGLG
jgi:HAD superfamily hydrolase (TIGR01509 family)